MPTFNMSVNFSVTAASEEVARRRAADELIKLLTKDRGAMFKVTDGFENEDEEDDDDDDDDDDEDNFEDDADDEDDEEESDYDDEDDDAYEDQ